MKITRKKATVVVEALQEWKTQGLIESSLHDALVSDLEISAFDWKRLAKYSFWAAIICILIAVGSVFADRALILLLESIFSSAAWAKSLGLTVLSAGFYTWGIRRRKASPQKSFSNEAILLLGVFATAGAVYHLGKTFGSDSNHFSILFLLATLIYASLGYVFRSTLIWIFALVSFGGWMGAETAYASGMGEYYLGMNYPLRFVIFGVALTWVSFFMNGWNQIQFLRRSTLILGMLYLFVALWILSITGNQGTSSWVQPGHGELFLWSLLFGAASAVSIYHGLRTANGITKGFGITFLLINLYTRYFEYFWDLTHKAIFFAILGASFWYLGTKAERVWNLAASAD